GPEARFILFNFPTATTLTLATGGATVEGTIYAPRADFTDLDQSN
ncbi:collagen-binding domain-containing protein, partial [Salinispora sp. H7-4]